MANTIDWGQAAVENTNGFGKSATNNTIDFGEVCANSWSPETNLTGTGATPSFSNIYSLLFDGIDSRIDLDSRTQNFTDFSLSFWVVYNGGNYKSIVGSSDLLQGGILFSIVQAGGQIRYYDNTSGWTNLSGSIIDGNWHHILITYDSSANTLLGYTDGSLTNTKTSVDPYGTSNFHSFDIIGARASGTNVYNEKLDEIAVFDSILDATQVSSIYNSGAPNDLSSLSPIHWWRFEEGSGTTATDSGSGGINGTLVASPTYDTNVPT